MVKGQDRSVELVDVFAEESERGSVETVDAARTGPGLPRWPWLAGGGRRVAGRRGRRCKDSGSPPSKPARPTAPFSSAAVRRFARAPAPGQTVLDVGRPLLAVPTRWDLFGEGSAVVVRIQLAPGTRHDHPTARRFALTPPALIALPGRVVVRPVSYGVGLCRARRRRRQPARRSPRPGRAGDARPRPRSGVGAHEPGERGRHPDDADRARHRCGGASVVIPGDGYLSPRRHRARHVRHARQ